MHIARMIPIVLLLLLAGCGGDSTLTPLAPQTDTAPTRLALAGPPATATVTPTATSTPITLTPTASPTFTATASHTPPPTPPETLTAAPITAVPTMLPPLPDSGETTVILLIGIDTADPTRLGRTDALLLVAVHHTAGTVTLLSIPRDLFVYIPTRGMDRINTAYAHGEITGYPGGGAALLRDTIVYNLGIHAPYYARVDFSGFESLVDALGGVDVTVDCPLQDWALRPGGDPANEDDWALLTLPVGVQHLDGRLALWYARSRRTSTDLDRSRRQQDILRAIGQRIRDGGWLDALPEAWNTLTAAIETNFTPDVLAGLVPLALNMDVSHVARLTFERGMHYRSWTTPDGQAVLLPEGEAVAALAADFLAPPTANRLVLNGASVHVVNHTGQPDLAQVAAARLAWEGLAATFDDSGGGAERAQTVIYDFTGRTKDSPLARLQDVLGVDDAHVIVRPETARTADFRVELGRDYDPCVYPVLSPR